MLKIHAVAIEADRMRLFPAHTHLDILLEALDDSPRMSTKSDDRVELLQGTLDLLILQPLRFGPTHGHAIAKTIERNSEDVLRVEQGSLYQREHRLIKRRWISSHEGTSENNRQAKIYRLTAKCRKQHDIEARKREKRTKAIVCILKPARARATS